VGWRLDIGAAVADDSGTGAGAASAGGTSGLAAAGGPALDKDLRRLGSINNERLCLHVGEEDFDEEELARRVAAKARAVGGS